MSSRKPKHVMPMNIRGVNSHPQGSGFEIQGFGHATPKGVNGMGLKVGATGQGLGMGTTGKSNKPGGSGGTRSLTKNIRSDPKKSEPPAKDSFSKLKVLPAIQTDTPIQQVLSGSLDDLPSLPSSVVRVFLSSTFSDMRVERDWLARHAYPDLQKYCSNLGLDFQVVDMRWGITDDATSDHMTEKLCLAEIENCRKVSCGPYFVSILGDRYGYRLFPVELESQEFNAVCKQAEQLNLPDHELLREWFRLDENANPPKYLLQTIRSKLPHFGDNDPENADIATQHRAEWWRTFRSLQVLLRAAVKDLPDSMISSHRKHEFFQSVTECEINEGIFGAENASSRTFVYKRQIQGLKEHLQDDKLVLHTDVKQENEQNIVDTDAEYYRNLLHQKVESAVSNLRVQTYNTIEWKDGGLQPETYPEHKKYIEDISKNFVEDIQKLVNISQKDQNAIEKKFAKHYAIYKEALHHLHFCVSKCQTFCGQTEALDEIRSKLLEGSGRQPVVLHAASGVGKTSVLAKATELFPSWLGNDCIRVIRFLGTTPDSTDILKVLRSICYQLIKVCKLMMRPGVFDGHLAVDNLPWLLRTVSRQTLCPVLIVLDSVDQLTPDHNAYDMNWVPPELPANVFMLISSLTEEHNCLKNLKSRIQTDGKPSSNFILLNPMPESTASDIMDTVLTRNCRLLTEQQRKLILTTFSHTPSPLFLKLLLDQALKWKSYDNPELLNLETTVQGAIKELFLKMERKYGKVFIQRMLGYITSGVNGLTEVEIEDVLSCDDDVLNDVYIYHDPPVHGIVSIPPLLWVRVWDDVKEYMVKRQSQNKTTVYWYHRQFIEVATAVYVKNSPENYKFLHASLASLYLAQDGVRRTIVLSHRGTTIEDADRQITTQKTSCSNQRKLVCLPHHLVESGRLQDFKNQVAFNLNFIISKVTAFSVQEMLDDIQKCLEALGGDDDMQSVCNCLKKNGENSYAFQPKKLALAFLGSLRYDVEAVHRFSMSEDTKSESLTQLLSQSKRVISASTKPMLEPVYPCLSDANSALKWSRFGYSKILSTSRDGMVILLENVASDSDRVEIGYSILDRLNESVRSLPHLEANRNLRLHPKLCFDGTAIAHVTNRQEFIVYDAKTDEKIWSIHPPSDTDGTVKGHEKSMQWVDYYVFDDPCPHAFITTAKHSYFLQPKKNHRQLFKDNTWAPALYSYSGKNVLVVAKNNELSCIWLQLNKDNLLAIKMAFVNSQETFGIKDKKKVTLNTFGEENRIVKAHAIDVIQTKDAFDGKMEYVAAVATDEFVQVVISGEIAHIFGEEGGVNISAVALRKDGMYLGYGNTVGVVTLCDLPSKSKILETKCHRCVVNSIQLIEQDLITVSEDGMLKIWDIDKMETDNKTKHKALPSKCFQNLQSAEILSVEFSKSEDYALVCLCDSVRCVDMESGQEIFCVKCDSPKQACFVGDDKYILVLAGKNTYRFAFTDPRVVESSVAEKMDENLDSTEENDLDAHKSTSDSAENENMHNISVKIGGLDVKEETETSEVSLETGKKIAHEGNAVKCLLMPSTSKMVLVITDDMSKVSQVEIWDFWTMTLISTHKLKEKQKFNFHYKYGVQLTDTGKYLVFQILMTTSELKTLEKKEPRTMMTAKNRFAAIDLEDERSPLINMNRILTKVSMRGYDFTMLPNNRVVVALNTDCAIWDLNTVDFKCDCETVPGAKTSVDGQSYGLNGKFYGPSEYHMDKNLKLQWKGHLTCCDAGNLSESDVVVLGSEDGFVIPYGTGGETLNNIVITKNYRHNAEVQQIAVSPNGRWVASWSKDHVLKLWDLPKLGDKSWSGCNVFTVTLDVIVKKLLFSNKGRYLAVIGETVSEGMILLLFKVYPEIREIDAKNAQQKPQKK